jgi:7-carboxy-7-deazaguanine synthase
LSMFASSLQSNFKFVVGSIDEVNEIEELIVSLRLPRDRVFLMPEGKLPSEINSKFQFVIESALQLGVNVTTRLHVLAYGDIRGV